MDAGAMPQLVAVGIGCRKQFARADIVALVRSTLADRVPPLRAKRLFTLIDKRGDGELAAAAALLDLELVFLSREALAAVAPRCLTDSRAAQRRFGLPSIAEAAALAGAGAGARLLGPRRIGAGVTCALALAAAEGAPR